MLISSLSSLFRRKTRASVTWIFAWRWVNLFTMRCYQICFTMRDYADVFSVHMLCGLLKFREYKVHDRLTLWTINAHSEDVRKSDVWTNLHSFYIGEWSPERSQITQNGCFAKYFYESESVVCIIWLMIWSKSHAHMCHLLLESTSHLFVCTNSFILRAWIFRKQRRLLSTTGTASISHCRKRSLDYTHTRGFITRGWRRLSTNKWNLRFPVEVFSRLALWHKIIIFCLLLKELIV